MRRATQLPLMTCDDQTPVVQRITEVDLLDSRPAVTDAGRFVGRMDSGGLGNPRYVIGEYVNGRMPTAFVLEYGGSSEATSMARVWRRADHSGMIPDYVISHDDSSSGYVTTWRSAGFSATYS